MQLLSMVCGLAVVSCAHVSHVTVIACINCRIGFIGDVVMAVYGFFKPHISALLRLLAFSRQRLISFTS